MSTPRLEFRINVVLNKFTLNHRNQIALIIVYNESNRTIFPCAISIEFGKPSTMVLVMGVKLCPWPSVISEKAHGVYSAVASAARAAATTCSAVTDFLPRDLIESIEGLALVALTLGALGVLGVRGVLGARALISS